MAKKHKHKTHPLRLTLAGAVGLGAIIFVIILAMNANSELDSNSIAFPGNNSNMLSLHPGSVNAQVGETRILTVDLNAAQPVNGADVVINFDPALLKVQPINASGATQAAMYLKSGSTIFPTFSKLSIDNSLGRISFSAAEKTGQTFSGTGRVAAIAFKVLKAGSAKVSLSYAAGKTNDTNLLASGKDVLQGVGGAVIISITQ